MIFLPFLTGWKIKVSEKEFFNARELFRDIINAICNRAEAECAQTVLSSLNG